MKFKCIVCGDYMDIIDGHRVIGSAWPPSWRCIDVQACVARFMLTAE